MLNLYTETAFQAVPPTPSSLLDFQIPRQNGSYDKSKYSDRGTTSYAKDENTFVNQDLASSSEIYFRQNKSYPRTFLWRVLSDCTLQVQCADLARGASDTKEAHLKLSFSFQDPILRAGITFTDIETENEIHIFVCTNRNELFHLRTPTSAFRSSESISQNVSHWCRPIEISTLSIETVFCIYASTPFELFISYTSGKLQRLRRKGNENYWIPENYDDRTWGASIRGIVGRGRLHTIEHGSLHLDPRVVRGMVASSDGNHLYTICLNHQLRVWHLATGRLVVTKDLLDITRGPNDRIQLNPAESCPLQILKLPLHKHPILVTYSPHEGGRFKFWDIKGGLTESLSIEDRYPKIKLSVPDPDPSGNTVWSMTSFKVSIGSDFHPAQLWVLWRNNNHHQLYTNHFDFGTLEQTWHESWVRCSTDTTMKISGPEFIGSDARDVTSKWLEFLFRPDFYPTSVLETALSIYQDSVSAELTFSQKSAGLKQRLCSVIAGTTTLRKYDESEMGYERFATDTDYHWRHYWRVVENINDGRRAPLALSYDALSEAAWILMADMCCAIRECSRAELLLRNDMNDLTDLETRASSRWPYRKISGSNEPLFQDMVILVAAARSFRRSFTPELVIDLATVIEEEILANHEVITTARIHEIYEGVNFGDAVSNESFHKLEKDLEVFGTLNELRNDLFFAVVNLFTNVPINRPAGQLRSTIFGLQLLSAGQVDMITSTRQLLRDLLVLIIFIEGELNQEDEKMTNFDGGELLEEIAPLLKIQERNFWLAIRVRQKPLDFHAADSRRNSVSDGDELDFARMRNTSLLEDILSKAVQPQPVVDKPLAYLITDSLLEIQDWTSGRNQIDPDQGSVYLQCDLLRHHEYDYAMEFLRFQSSSSWSTYVKGRLYLAKGIFDVAEQYFRKAAYGLACGKAIGDLHGLSAGLLSKIEVESFNNGMPCYFYHVLTIFESVNAFSQAAKFARLALQSMLPNEKDASFKLRSEMLSRLFTAELKQCKFEPAFETLVQFSDQALQRSSAISLITAIVASRPAASSTADLIAILLSLPWSLHPHLARLLHQQISDWAKKQKSVTSDSNEWTVASSNVDFLKIVYAIRISHGDYRGAVSILFDRLRLIQNSGKLRNDPQATALRQTLLALINAMTCVAADEAYILTDTDNGPKNTLMQKALQINGEVTKREKMIVTLSDLRKEYQQILDKCSRIERGDFDFDIGSESDEDEEMEMDHSKLRGVGRSEDVMEF